MKETEDLRENKRRRQDKKLDSTFRRTSRNWISTVYRRGKLAPVAYIHFHDRRTGSYQCYITYQEFTHSITISFISAAAFGIGLGQLITGLTQ